MKNLVGYLSEEMDIESFLKREERRRLIEQKKHDAKKEARIELK